MRAVRARTTRLLMNDVEDIEDWQIERDDHAA
ncbi:MAG: hypothetical protein RL672_685, partial [Actinomycetota bacterium]